MHNVTQNFLNTIKLPNRGFKSTVKIRDTIFDDTNIIDMSLEENVNPADSFMLGSVASNKLEITLIDVPNILILENAIVNPKLSLLVGSNYEEVPLGVFTVDEISKDKGTVKLTCFDNMIKLEKTYFSNLSYPASINSVAQEICSKAGVQLATTLPSTLINKIEGYTYREAISFIASFLGGFARFNRLGKLEIVSYGTTNVEVTGDNYFKLTTNEKPFSIGRLACQVGENIISVGASGNEIKFENPIMTQVQLNNIFNTLRTLSYMPYSMDWQGNPALMAGDKIKIIDVKGNTYNALLMQQKLSYKGGLSSTSKAVGKTEQAQEFSSNGSMKNKVERVVIEQANIKLALIEKATIEDLTVVNARIDNLYTTDLKVVNAKITNLEVYKADAIKLNAEIARINDLYAKKADIIDLTAISGKINILETKVGTIDTILSKEIFVELATAGKIVAGSSIIAEGAIGSAQINSLDLNKLNAGSIDTSKIQLVGPNGRLKLVGNKLQIFDTINGQQFERVMLGIDDSNNSTIVLRGADGKTILLNQDGLTKPGFTDGYNKLEDNSLPGTKLDINSVMRGMNEKGTETIKGTKVSIGDRTLDVELSTQKNLIDGANKELSTQKATITAMDSAIKLKVDNQTFNTFKSTTDGSIGVINTTLNKNTASIDVLQKQIVLKVSQTDIDKSLNDLDIGVRNLVINSGFTQPNFKGWEYFYLSGTAGGFSNVDEPKAISKKALQFKLTASTESVGGIYLATHRNNFGLSIKIGKDYTCSGYIKRNKSTEQMLINSQEKGGTPLVLKLMANQWVYFKYTFTAKEPEVFMFFTDMAKPFHTLGDTISLYNFSFVEGNKVGTEWVAAPEDTDQTVRQVDEKIDTKVSEINTTLGGIDLRVTSSESNIKHTDGRLSLLDTRVKQAEIKITDDAIVYTVRNSSAYKSDLINKANQTDMVTAQSQIVQMSNKLELNVSETSNLKGVVNNHTSGIQILSNQIANKVDANGVISTVTQNAGTIISDFSKLGEVIIKNGNFSIEHANGGKMFWVQGGRISAAALDLYAVADGTFKIYGPGAKGVQLISENDKEIYIDFKRSGTAPYNGRISMPKTDQLAYIAPSHYFASTTGTTKLTVQGSIFSEHEVYATNKVEGDTVHSRSGYITSNSNFWFTDPTLKGFMNIRGAITEGATLKTNTGYLVSDKAFWFTDPAYNTLRDINVKTAIHHGAKTALVDTKSYGKTFMYAEEGPTPTFVDYGGGIIGEDGLCYIYLDPQFAETISTNDCDYWIQLTGWTGCIAEINGKEADYFVVSGNPNKKFEWKAIGERKGYERLRFNEAMEANNIIS